MPTIACEIKDEQNIKGESNSKLINIMLEKSQESFLLALELYNKPNNRIKIEGFCFFICNAWELLLKAYFLKTNKKIHYKDGKNKNRTISLSDCVKLQFTNKNDPTRINLEIVISTRNFATHLIIPEYAELLHGPFLACTHKYCEKLFDYFNVSINEKLSSNFLTLFIPSHYNEIHISKKYPTSISKKYSKVKKFVKTLIENSTDSNGYVNQNISLEYELKFKQVRNVEEADFKTCNVPIIEGELRVIKEKVPIDYSESHPYNRKNVIDKVNSELKKQMISFIPVSAKAKKEFNTHTFKLYSNKFDIKNNISYCKEYKFGEEVRYSYSPALINIIIKNIMNDSAIFINIKKS